jgi:PAS domain S-box/PAS domain S-box
MMTPPPKQQTLTRKVLIIFGCIIVFESVFLLSLLGLLEDSKQRLAEERYARSVVAAIAKITATMHSGSQMLIRQTLLAQTAEKYRTLEEFRQIFLRMPRDIKALNDLLAAEPERQPRLRELNSSIEEVLDLADKVSASALDRETQDKKRLHLHYSVQVSDVARSIATQLDDLEKIYTEIELANKRAVAFRSDVLLNAFLGAGFLSNAAIAFGLYMFFVRGLTKRLKIVADNTVNLIVGKPLLAPVSGDDELARLDLTFREMATNLEEIRTKEAVILEHATNFICSLTTKGVFVSVPAASSAMWGYKQEELVGRRLSSLVLPEQYELTRKRLESLTQNGMSTSFENSVRCGDGKIVELEWTANLNRDGTVVCVARNITERSRIHNLIKKSERRFSSIVEQLPVAIVSCDRSFVIESVNPSTSRLFQYQPNELLGKRVDVLLYGPTSAHQRIEMSEDLKQLMELATREATHLNVYRRDSSQFPVELNLSTYEAPQGQRYLACFNDISMRVELELAKRDFVSMIGHDLRSPLMSLLGTLGMMASNTVSGTKFGALDTESGTESGTSANPERGYAASDARTFQEAEHLVERLVDLIGDFLDLGKMEAGFDSLYVTERR